MLRQVLLLLALALCLSFVQANLIPDDTSNIYANVTSADFFVSVSVNSAGLPVWKYNEKDNSSTVYQVSFLGLWETENTTDYDIVSTSVINKYQTRVNAGGKANNSQVINVDLAGINGYLNLTTHVPLGSVGNETTYPAAKFDVNIGNYKWVSGDEDAQLVLAFKVAYYQTVNNAVLYPNVSTHGSETINFANGYFSINDSAKAGSGAKNLSQTIDVSLKKVSDINSSMIPSNIAYSESLVYIVYDNFNVDSQGVNFLNHDPEFGFGSGPSNHYMWIIIIVAVVVAIIVIILIAVIGFVLVRRRRRSYDAF